MARRLGDPVVLADTLLFHATSLKSFDPNTAECLFLEGLSLVRRSGDVATAALMHGDFADFLLLVGRVDEARQHLETALDLVNVPGFRVAEIALGNLGLVHLDQGDATLGASIFAELLRRARRSGDLDMAGFATLGLACCTTAMGDAERAATLFGGADRLFEMLGYSELQATDKHYHDRHVEFLRAALGTHFEPRYESGRTMTRAEIIDFALHA